GALLGEGLLRTCAGGNVLGLADQPLGTDVDVLQEELPGGGGVQTHLPERLRLREPGRPLVEDEAQDFPVFWVTPVVELANEDDGVGVGTVGDERLAAVQ